MGETLGFPTICTPVTGMTGGDQTASLEGTTGCTFTHKAGAQSQSHLDPREEDTVTSRWLCAQLVMETVSHSNHEPLNLKVRLFHGSCFTHNRTETMVDRDLSTRMTGLLDRGELCHLAESPCYLVPWAPCLVGEVSVHGVPDSGPSSVSTENLREKLGLPGSRTSVVLTAIQAGRSSGDNTSRGLSRAGESELHTGQSSSPLLLSIPAARPFPLRLPTRPRHSSADPGRIPQSPPLPIRWRPRALETFCFPELHAQFSHRSHC